MIFLILVTFFTHFISAGKLALNRLYMVVYDLELKMNNLKILAIYHMAKSQTKRMCIPQAIKYNLYITTCQLVNYNKVIWF